jgi:hypothetical protein
VHDLLVVLSTPTIQEDEQSTEQRDWNVGEKIQANIHGKWADAVVLSVKGSAQDDPPTDVYELSVGDDRGEVPGTNTRGPLTDWKRLMQSAAAQYPLMFKMLQSHVQLTLCLSVLVHYLIMTRLVVCHIKAYIFSNSAALLIFFLLLLLPLSLSVCFAYMNAC